MPESASWSITIEGLPELIAKLEAATREDVIKQSLYQGATTIAAWSKANRLSGPRPQFLGVKTGRLRSSIAVAPTEHAGNEYITRIGTNVIYGPIHEFGGRIGKRGTMPARPFLHPALEDEGNRMEVLNILVENINTALESAKA